MKNINWPEIRNDYITASMSCRALGRKYGVDNTNIARRAKKEDWPSAKREYQEELVRESIDRISEKRAETFGEYTAEFKTDIIRVHRMLMAKIYETLTLKKVLSPKELKMMYSMTKDMLRNWYLIDKAEPRDGEQKFIIEFIGYDDPVELAENAEGT